MDKQGENAETLIVPEDAAAEVAEEETEKKSILMKGVKSALEDRALQAVLAQRRKSLEINSGEVRRITIFWWIFLGLSRIFHNHVLCILEIST